METKAELIQQLTKMRDLLDLQDDYQREIADINMEIDKLQQELQKGIVYQDWNPTNNADRAKQALEQERHAKTVKRRVPCIIALPVCGFFGFSFFTYGTTYSEGFKTFCGIVLLLIAVVALVILIRVNKNGNDWSDSQLAELQSAEKKDAENRALNERKRAELEAALQKKNNERIANLNKQKEKVNNTLLYVNRELWKYDILAEKDRHWRTVHKLIEILQSNRANTLSEALRIYDEQQHRERMRKDQREANWEQQRIQQKILDQMKENEAHRQEEAELLRQDQLRRDREQAEHNREMEHLAQQQINELERQRQADRDYRQSGYIGPS